MINQNPEQNTLDRIDRLLADGGWVVQDFKKLNLAASIGVAVPEYSTDVALTDNVPS